jgi:uncharacterized protein
MAIEEEEVRFRSGEITLAGTLALPAEDDGGGVPGVVFIHGSGAVDRNENPDPELAGAHIRGLELNIFSDLAASLAEGGIASLRYDKRGVGESEGDFNTRRVQDLVDDIRAAIGILRAHPKVDSKRIFLVGHSEGGMLGPRVILEEPEIAGFVSCAGTVRNLQDIIRFQSQGAMKAAIEQGADPAELEKKAAESVAALMSSDSVENSMGWLRDWFQADMVATLSNVRCPVLIIQGDKDGQVPWVCALEMAEVLRSTGNQDVELALFANIDHLLKFEPLASVQGSYHRGAGRPTEPIVANTLVRWCQRIAAGEPPAAADIPTQSFLNGFEALSAAVGARSLEPLTSAV